MTHRSCSLAPLVLVLALASLAPAPLSSGCVAPGCPLCQKQGKLVCHASEAAACAAHPGVCGGGGVSETAVLDEMIKTGYTGDREAAVRDYEELYDKDMEEIRKKGLKKKLGKEAQTTALEFSAYTSRVQAEEAERQRLQAEQEEAEIKREEEEKANRPARCKEAFASDKGLQLCCLACLEDGLGQACLAADGVNEWKTVNPEKARRLEESVAAPPAAAAPATRARPTARGKTRTKQPEGTDLKPPLIPLPPSCDDMKQAACANEWKTYDKKNTAYEIAEAKYQKALKGQPGGAAPRPGKKSGRQAPSSSRPGVVERTSGEDLHQNCDCHNEPDRKSARCAKICGDSLFDQQSGEGALTSGTKKQMKPTPPPKAEETTTKEGR